MNRNDKTPKTRTPDGGVEPAGVPDAVQAANVARARRIGLDQELAAGKARGVDWVRPSDLIARGAGHLAGRGIDFQAELFRKARTGIATTARHGADRVKQLPPVSAFGRRSATPEAASRGPVGRA